LVFKRREKRGILGSLGAFLWPKGGWARAFHYVKHRVRRLPDSPDRIARGIWAGVFAAFTPFYGIHFFIAGFLAYVMRGNVLASLMATFFGNPLTYVPIGVAALQTGHWMLGTRMDYAVAMGVGPNGESVCGFGCQFSNAVKDLWHNFFAMFSDETAHWDGLKTFYDEVFFTYMIGGIVTGIIAATICYYVSLPLIGAYQKRRKGAIKAKLDAIKAKAAAKAELKAEMKAEAKKDKVQ